MGSIPVVTLTKRKSLLSLILIGFLGWAWQKHVLESTQRSTQDNVFNSSNEPQSRQQNSPENWKSKNLTEKNASKILHARTLIDQKQFTAGLEELKRLVAAEKNNTEALMELAMTYILDIKDNASARPLLEEIIDIDPDNLNAIRELEHVYKDLAMIDDGIRYFQLKNEQNPDSHALQLGLGRLLKNEQPSDAIYWLKKASIDHRLQEQALDDLASTAEETNNLQLAIESWETLLRLVDQNLKEAIANNEPGVEFIEEKINSTKLEIAKAKTKLNDQRPQNSSF